LKRLERPAEAAKAFKTALTEDPESRPVRFDYAMFLAENGQPLEALKLLHELAFEKPEEVSIWLAAGRIALSRPETLEFACDWTGEAITLFPSEPQLLMQRAEALLLSQHPAEALSVLREIRGTPSPHLEAARLLCELLGNQDWSRRTSPEPVLSQEFLKWYRALLDRGAEPLVGAINSRLDRLRQVLPSASRWLEQALLEADREAAV
jgi:predicted Zn-dependent protease